MDINNYAFFKDITDYALIIDKYKRPMMRRQVLRRTRQIRQESRHTNVNTKKINTWLLNRREFTTPIRHLFSNRTLTFDLNGKASSIFHDTSNQKRGRNLPTSSLKVKPRAAPYKLISQFDRDVQHRTSLVLRRADIITRSRNLDTELQELRRRISEYNN